MLTGYILQTIIFLEYFYSFVSLLDGYAFSQEEGGNVTQTDIIRAYNTNIPKPDGM